MNLKNYFLMWGMTAGARFKRILFWSILLALLVTTLGSMGIYRGLRPYYRRAQHYNLSKIKDFDVTTVFFDRYGEEIGRIFVEDRKLATHSQIPDLMRKAMIAAEDKRFYFHHGVDVRAVCRALWINIKAGARSQGGSTLTQQLAKHLTENNAKTIDRKLVEAFLAFRIEKKYSKDEILDFYLNRIYFGKGHFGLDSAAHGYFGKSPMDLNVAECALLAGVVKAPNSRSPCNDLNKAREWRNVVIQKMWEQNFIASREARMAKTSSIELAPVATSGTPGGVRSYFVGVAEKELEEVLKLKDENEIPQGLRVNTTLDLHAQKAAEVKTLKKLREIESQIASQKLDENPSERGPLQAASMVMDLNSGAVRVLIGGRDFHESPFNRATMARRENGSLLQPFLYALAFEKLKLHPASMVMASYIDPTDAAQPEEVGLVDSDLDPTKHLLMVQDAMAFSNKASATRTGLQLGIPSFIQWLVSAGVAMPKAETFENFKPLTLAEVTSLYQLMGNSGVRRKPYTIVSVLNSQEEVLYQAAQPISPPLLDPLVAQQMTLTLRAVTREGTAEGLSNDYAFPAPVVGMTGYSEGYRDAWFVGYTPGYVAGVWMGFDRSIPIGNKSIATHSALPLWSDIMQKVLENDLKGGVFPIPSSLSKVEINRRTGAMRGVGLLTPSPGDIFVYLTPPQISALSHEENTTEDPKEKVAWAAWLSTMINTPDQDASKLALEKRTEEAHLIPQVAEYRVPALRGDILTADGQILATTLQTQDLVLSWPAPDVAFEDNDVMVWARKQLDVAGKWLGQGIDIPDSELLGQYRFQRFHPITVAKSLTPKQIEDFRISGLTTKGFSLQGVPRRSYPHGRFFAHGVGYLKRIQGRNHKEYQPDDVIYENYEGSTGLEEVFNTQLLGKEGHLTINTTPEGFTKKASVEAAATVGLTVRTTIDSRTQSAVEQSMSKIRAGAVVVLNWKTGDVLAMASRPDFDPGSFIPALSPEQWQALVSAEHNPLFNRTYRQRHPPGSTFKVITSIAAMRAGVFDRSRVVDCPGYYNVGNIVFHFPNETQSVSYHDALARSCNTYFIDLGLRAGRDALIAAAHDLGVGKPTGIILPDESSGLMPDPSYVRITHQRNMGPGDVANSSIGQGDVLVTPLQMANWMAAIANNGTLFKPRLVSQIENASGAVATSFPNEILNQINFSSDSIKDLRDGLLAVVQDGTGSPAQAPGIVIAAKTGTAQIGSKLMPRQIAWMTGYLPEGQFPYAFAVMVEGDADQDLHGGPTAGPIVSEIFTKICAKPALTSIDP